MFPSLWGPSVGPGLGDMYVCLAALGRCTWTGLWPWEYGFLKKGGARGLTAVMMLKNRPREFKQEGRTRGASQWQGTCLASVKSEFHARTTRNKFIRLVGLLSSVHKALGSVRTAETRFSGAARGSEAQGHSCLQGQPGLHETQTQTTIKQGES